MLSDLLLEQIVDVISHFSHRPAEIDAHDRAAGARRLSAGEAQREGRALEPLLEPRRKQADDPGGPRRPRHDNRRAPLLEAERQQRFRLGLRQRFDLDLLANAVQPVELDCDRARVDVVGPTPLDARFQVCRFGGRLISWAKYGDILNR